MQNKILKILTSTDNYISGQSISKQLGVSRQAIWKAINALKEKGYSIESATNKGYRLTALPSYVNENAVKENLHTKIIGKQLIVLDTVDSTNDYLKAKGNEGCENGTVVVSREQNKGKGRLGRVWQAEKDDCIAFSFLMRPHIAPNEVSAITPLTGLAVCKALREFTGLECRIKWPNDIIVGRKKLVGILTEMSAELDAVDYIVTGIGINADNTDFPEDIVKKATSIVLELGKKIDKNKLLACVLDYIEDVFIKNDLTLSSNAISEYTELCATIGKDVTFFRSNQSLNGTAKGINDRGELMVELTDGTIRFINSGEVTVQGIY